jgi:hypothetical protein
LPEEMDSGSPSKRVIERNLTAFISLRDRAKKDRAKLTTEDKTDFSDTACGRARHLAGRMASPIDEASIPPGIVRPVRRRALMPLS